MGESDGSSRKVNTRLKIDFQSLSLSFSSFEDSTQVWNETEDDFLLILTTPLIFPFLETTEHKEEGERKKRKK